MEQSSTAPLGKSEREELLRIARKTLEAYLKERRFPKIEPKNESLKRLGGAFVTLEKGGELRGCIGHMVAERPLYLTVQQMAIQAATGDPRFPPVTADELSEIDIEISALSPFRRISDLSEIKVGEHGLVVSKDFYRGVLLPQVATREKWDRDTFLSYTCMKAGLPPDSWRSGGITIEIFSAQVFGERSL